MVKMFQLSLAGAAKRVSDVYGGVAGADPNPALDLSYRAIYLYAETGALAIGDAATVSASVYGNLIAAAATLPLQPAQPGSPMHLSDFWAFGTGTLHILAIPL
jgi:hypothetical protein